MDDNFIDYGELIDDAMHVIVRQVLERAQKTGLPGSHHFYISFLTNHPGVTISSRLKEKYPEDMTIVLQHQYENLDVDKEKFGVTLSFESIKERIVIPFDALTAFADPSVKFGLQFRSIEMLENEEDDLDLMGEVHDLISEGISDEADLALNQVKETKKKKESTSKSESNVVSIDSFRKK